MRHVIGLLAVLLFVLIAGCNRGGNRLIVGNIEGPDEVVENSSAEYSIDARGDTGITYGWAVSPSSMGRFSGQDAASTIFTAAEVESDTAVVIRVVVNSDRDGPVVRSLEVTVKNVPDEEEDNQPPIARAHAESTVIHEGEHIQFYDDSTDPDGDDDIVEWEWDFSFDAVDGFQTESEEREPYVQFPNPGEFKVQLRVTDSGGNWDVLDEPLVIMVNERGWVLTWGGDGSDESKAIAVDSFGNIYVTGGFQGTVDFDPGPGQDLRTASGSRDVFLLKFSERGNLLWALTWGGGYGDGIAVASNGNVYVIGYYTDCSDLDPGPGVCPPVANRGDFFTEFDSQGSFLRAPSTESWCDWTDEYYWWHWEEYQALGVDAPFVYLAYECGETYSADQEAWGWTHTSLLKKDEAGEIVWRVALPDGVEVGGIEVSEDETVFITFYEAYPDHSARLAAYSSDGQLLWDRSWGDDQFGLAAPAVDEWGNIYIAGDFLGSQDFDPGPGEWILHVDGWLSDPYLSKFSSTGEFEWAVSWGSPMRDTAKGVATDLKGNVYVTGEFIGYVDFDTGPGTEVRFAEGKQNTYLTVFDPDGEWLWVGNWGSPQPTHSGGVVASDSGNGYVAGWFEGNVDFNPSWDVDIYTSSSEEDAYLIKVLPRGRW